MRPPRPLVPKLRLGTHTGKLRFPSWRGCQIVARSGSRASPLAFPSGAWERGVAADRRGRGGGAGVSKFWNVSRGDVMAIKVQIPTPMRQHAEGQTTVAAAGSTVQAVLDDLGARFPAL